MPEKPGIRYELVSGELIEVPGASIEHAFLAKHVVKLLDSVVETHDLGIAVGDGAAFLLRRHPDLLRIPDAAFISWDRLPDRKLPRSFVHLIPDLAVEIVSPNDRANEISEKVHEYLDAGTSLVWILWPRRRMVSVYEPDRDIRELGADDYLDGGDVLPGFRVLVADIFAVI
ncbi:MAG: Uma2 family endonuclease [Thermomicrobiales bacterium]